MYKNSEAGQPPILQTVPGNDNVVRLTFHQ
jgi:hypothetical protein